MTSRTLIISLSTVFASYWVLFAVDVYTRPPVTEADTARALAYVAERQKPLPPIPFTHDGCTAFPDNFLGHNFYQSCVKHDIRYWLGGTTEERRAANITLKYDVAATGPLGPFFGVIMYTAIQYLGDNWVSHYRGTNWGYGWNS